MTQAYLENKSGQKIAYCYTAGGRTRQGALPAVLFCGGLRSDMGGTKATFLEAQCKARGQSYLRFDYSGHGVSDGVFEEGTIGQWTEDGALILDFLYRQSGASVLLVGSSMGGWIGLKLLTAQPGKIMGLVGIAAAPDFTLWMEDEMSAAQKQELEQNGFVKLPNDYSDEPYHVTRKFIEDGREQCILVRKYMLEHPISLLQGKQDKDVPWQTVHNIEHAFPKATLRIQLIDDGDHRLSRPDDLALLDGEIRVLSGV